jgi:hypothetical protein
MGSNLVITLIDMKHDDMTGKMDNTIFIHIGTHKTGTSAIQDFMALNKKLLARKGVLFPQKSRRHYFESSDESYHITDSHRKHYRALVKQCQKQKKDILLSSETFSVVDNIAEMKAFLADAPVKIICYLRRQDAFKQSLYNQMVKEGKVCQDILECQGRAVFDYYQFLGKWASVFGKKNLIVRVFEKQQFVNQDLIEDFLNILGLRLTDEFSKLKKNPNPRLSPESLEYMRFLNSIFQDKSKSKQFRQSVIEYSAKQARDSTMSVFFNQSLLSFEQRQAMYEEYNQSNRLVAQEYLERSDGQLFCEPLSEGAQLNEPYEGLTDDRVLEITRFLCRNRTMKKKLVKAVKKEDSGEGTYSANARKRIGKAIRLLESE